MIKEKGEVETKHIQSLNDLRSKELKIKELETENNYFKTKIADLERNYNEVLKK